MFWSPNGSNTASKHPPILPVKVGDPQLWSPGRLSTALVKFHHTAFHCRLRTESRHPLSLIGSPVVGEGLDTLKDAVNCGCLTFCLLHAGLSLRSGCPHFHLTFTFLGTCSNCCLKSPIGQPPHPQVSTRHWAGKMVVSRSRARSLDGQAGNDYNSGRWHAAPAIRSPTRPRSAVMSTQSCPIFTGRFDERSKSSFLSCRERPRRIASHWRISLVRMVRPGSFDVGPGISFEFSTSSALKPERSGSWQSA